MNAYYSELAFRREVERLLGECRGLWSVYARQRGLGMTVGGDGSPILAGRLEGAPVELFSSGNADRGFRTRARIEVKLSEAGTLHVHPPNAVQELVGQIFHRDFFGIARLDERLVVRSSPSALAKEIVDEPVRNLLGLVVDRPLYELVYAGGVLSFTWAGVEHDVPTLDATLDLLAHLAGRGAVNAAPYR